ncbi:hypothetical protein J3B02_000127 [Coemansia erecta]|uniref:N-acetyltransferase domain-containing protein n=1 Tax=Coemansia asiatica TaxID=1052880 RepID=A0A9W7XNG1_9FUNG|nr:hypothetical protein LPJ64_000224 [Coemansia asiatica]KAJ2858537.1 hypothetical protein J3B02_000127 [Coemansia erecta]KAJ2889201.1 hypothetical protein FB639_000070 [Coemansia asiatica]
METVTETALVEVQPTESGHQIQLQTVDAITLPKVRNLNSVLFPVRYSGTFYKSLLLPGQFCQLAFLDDKCVGTIACRKQPLGFADTPASIMTGYQALQEPKYYEVYMMTLGVLAPYRRLGIGGLLLRNAVEFAAKDPNVRRVILHVQIDNDDALRFYHKSGFTTVRLVQRYYKNIEPPHAYLLEYRIR